jgi:hypothetical protein
MVFSQEYLFYPCENQQSITTTADWIESLNDIPYGYPSVGFRGGWYKHNWVIPYRYLGAGGVDRFVTIDLLIGCIYNDSQFISGPGWGFRSNMRIRSWDDGGVPSEYTICNVLTTGENWSLIGAPNLLPNFSCNPVYSDALSGPQGFCCCQNTYTHNSTPPTIILSE